MRAGVTTHAGASGTGRCSRLIGVSAHRPLHCQAQQRRWAHACSGSAEPGSVTTIAPHQGAAAIKQQLAHELEGINRGIFGAQAAKRQAIADLVSQLEALNPLPAPTEHLQQLAGDWSLLYTTITITGAKKTKLGLREFVTLGEFTQRIDTANSLAENIVAFSVAGLGTLSGALTVKATYKPSSPTRVDITFLESVLVPKQLQQIFQMQYDLLLSIFNPDGWLDITYVDADTRVGRDDKGNLFVLQRSGQ